MNIRYIVVLGLGLVSFCVAGCADTRELRHQDALRSEPAWPDIHAAAEKEVARREGNTKWSHLAYYWPTEHTNGVWVVTASAPYPSDRMGDFIDMRLRDNGETIYYAPHLPSCHPK